MIELRIARNADGDDTTFNAESVNGFFVGYIDQWDADAVEFTQTPAAAYVEPQFDKTGMTVIGVTLRIVPLTMTLSGVTVAAPQPVAAGVEDDKFEAD